MWLVMVALLMPMVRAVQATRQLMVRLVVQPAMVPLVALVALALVVLLVM